MEIDNLLTSAFKVLAALSIDVFEFVCQNQTRVKRSNSFQMTQTQDSDMTAKYVKLTDYIKPLSQYDAGSVKDECDMEEFFKCLGIDAFSSWSETFGKRVKRVAIAEWMCSDTIVGIHLYFFDGEFVAVSFQSARKSRVQLKWANLEAAGKIRKFIYSILEEELSVVLIEPDELIDRRWFER